MIELTKKQIDVIKTMIMNSMRDVYTSAGSLPGEGFEHAASLISDKIIKNVQNELLFEKTITKKKHVKR